MDVSFRAKISYKILGCRDPRYKHKYLDKGENTKTNTKVRIQKNLNALTKRYDDENDESDKQLEAWG